MDVIVIAGFLGSGKTSVLLRLARPFTQSGRKVAVIENEVGKVGVDDQLVAAEGLSVRELYSGCICCSLRLDLVHTLLDLERTCHPDVVLLEPSGVAGPDMILDALIGYGGEIARRLVMVVVDATRASLLQSRELPIVTRGVKVAQLLLLNKADAADEPTLLQAGRWLRTLNAEAPILPVSAQTGDGMDEVVEQALCLMSKPADPVARLTHREHERTDTQMAVFSWLGRLALPAPITGKDLQDQMASLLQQMAVRAAEGQTALTGHIKAIFKEASVGGYWSVSTTSVGAVPQTRGRLPETVTSGEFTLNAIVYGVTTESLTEAFHDLRRTTCFARAEEPVTAS